MHGSELAKHISRLTGEPFELSAQHAVGGGCINTAYQVHGRQGERFFVKFNHADKLEMFEAEAAGLQELAKAQAVRVPVPIGTGTIDQQAFLIMEDLPLTSSAGRNAMTLLGEQLANLHHTTQNRFGWHRDNTIGATPQPNAWHTEWIKFFQEQRLGYQLRLAAQNGMNARILRQGEKLQDALPTLFSDYAPMASVLHGDLWGGNVGVLENGEPVIFDPAVYFGDRETDLAMTELFGGFGADFYAAYTSVWPLDCGYKVRKTLYNLYHILNHYNLFGGGYASQAEGMIQRLLAELS